MARQPQAQKAPEPQPEPVTTAGGPLVGEANGILTIDLGALTANYKALTRRVVPSECAAVVKGDAYGCGIEPVTAALVRAGCKTFFVAHLMEARQVRAVAPDATIYVLNGFASSVGDSYIETSARPVINSTVELAEWDHFIAVKGWTGGAALHVDTGMNRLGLTVEEAAALVDRIRNGNHGITLLMSHLACAEKLDHPLNDLQIRQFRDVRTHFRGVSSSLANSAGIFLDPSTHCDLVRPGLAIYGANPTPGEINPMQPVVTVQARVLQVRSVEKNATVGYGATWTAKRSGQVAVFAAGYADGYLRAEAMDGKREVVVAGKRCPVVGRVSMDLMTVDVSDLPAGAVRRDQMVTLIGDGLSIDDVAAQSGTIAYEVLTNLGRRFHCVWKA